MFVDEPDGIGVSAIVSALDAGAAVQVENLLRESQVAGNQEEKHCAMNLTHRLFSGHVLCRLELLSTGRRFCRVLSGDWWSERRPVNRLPSPGGVNPSARRRSVDQFP